MTRQGTKGAAADAETSPIRSLDPYGEVRVEICPMAGVQMGRLCKAHNLNYAHSHVFCFELFK